MEKKQYNKNIMKIQSKKEDVFYDKEFLNIVNEIYFKLNNNPLTKTLCVKYPINIEHLNDIECLKCKLFTSKYIIYEINNGELEYNCCLNCLEEIKNNYFLKRKIICISEIEYFWNNRHIINYQVLENIYEREKNTYVLK